jgi:hypothetical protein
MMSNVLQKPDPDGPENIPLRGFNKSFKVAVFVYNLKKSDEIIEMYEIDYGKVEDRQWLGKMSFYAWNKGWSIETMSLSDAEGKS